MAKAAAEQTSTETTTEGAAVAAVAESTGRSVILTLDAEHAAFVGVEAGATMKRTDYIRARWQQGNARGPISKELTKLQGKDVPYQIVFQATKGIEGGPTKTTPAATPAEGETAALPVEGNEAA